MFGLKVVIIITYLLAKDVYCSKDCKRLVSGEWVDGKEQNAWDSFTHMCGVAVDYTSIQKVYTFLFILIHLQSYCYVGKNEYSSFLKHSYIKCGLYCPELLHCAYI